MNEIKEIINVNNTALLVVDMIYDFAHPNGKVFYPQNLEILPKILEALKAMREVGGLVIFALHYHRKDVYDRELCSGRRLNSIEGSGGELLLSELEFDEKHEFIVKKRRYNSFCGTDLDSILREHKIQNLAIVGTKTNCCIRATVEGAYHLEYLPIVIEECVATNDEVINRVHLTDIEKYLGKVISLQHFLKLMKGGAE